MRKSDDKGGQSDSIYRSVHRMWDILRDSSRTGKKCEVSFTRKYFGGGKGHTRKEDNLGTFVENAPIRKSDFL